MPGWLDDKKAYFDFDAIFSEFSGNECQPVLLSQRDISILVSLLKAALWDSRWTDSSGRRLREIGRLPDLEIAKTFVEGLEARLIMGCTQWVDALNGIASAITNKPTCCGVSGPGYVSDGSGGVWYGSEEPLTAPVTFGGENDQFATVEEFEAHRCLAANNIASGLILTLNFWSVLDLIGLTAGGLITAFFVSNPPVALFVALFVAAGSFVILATISDYIDTHRQELVCAIYGSETYGDFLAAIDQFISDLVVNLDIGPLGIPLIELIHAALSTDVFNTLFAAVGLPPVTDAVDCATCTETYDCPIEVTLGYGDPEEGGDFTGIFDTAPTPDVYRLYLYLGRNRNVTVNSITNYTDPGTTTVGFRMFTLDAECAAGDSVVALRGAGPAVGNTYCVGVIVVQSTTDFTVNFTFGEDC